MSNLVLSHSERPFAPPCHGARGVVSLALVLWLMLVLLLGANGWFLSPPGKPPFAILLGVAAPLIAFFAAYRLSEAFRDLVLAADLRFMAAVQAWRFAGFGFLALYVHGVLPGVFAWPAGLGDMAIGIAAPWIIVALIRRPDFAAGKAFKAWNALGILDLVVAVGIGGLTSALAVGAPGEITARPMAEMPLVLIPGYLVPLFVMLHIASLLQARRMREAEPGTR